VRVSHLFVSAGVLAAIAAPLQSRQAPFVPVAVEYVAPSGAARDRIAADLQAIRGMGFNAIELVVRWAEAEPQRGAYGFGAVDRVLGVAPQANLRVAIRLDSHPPEWILRRYRDGRRVPEKRKPSGTQAAAQVCFDHPGIRADLRGFVAAASAHVARQPAVHAIDVFGNPPAGLCLCPHTAQRAREYAAKGASAGDEFLRRSMRDDLESLVAASPPRGARLATTHTAVPSVLASEPGQDDWQMAGVVDRLGLSASSDLLASGRFALALDGLAGAARQTGWWMRGASIPAAHRRFAAWAAISRGASALVDDSAPDRATFEGVITRNPSLFAPLKPMASKAALVFDPRDQSETSAASLSRAHAALFRLNIPVDILHVDHLVDALRPPYRALVMVSAAAPSAAAGDALRTFVSAGGTVVDAAQVMTDERLSQLLALAGVQPAARLDAGHGAVETRFLESADVLMLIALNHADSSQKVTMTFAPDVQEAIWQNMETGAGVSFVAGPTGPSYNYWFAPKDALVLMIRKDVR
jgi:hypothetical protein